MTDREMILAFDCPPSAIRALDESDVARGVVYCTTESVAVLTREVTAHQPAVVVLGISSGRDSTLDTIDVIHAVLKTTPIIVIAADDSLELERNCREKSIFYYLVEPIDRSELKAVIESALQFARKL